MTKAGDNKSNSDHMDFIGWTNKCQSDVIIYDAQYYMTDPEHLIVPYENVEQYMFLALFQSHPATIPCRPTYSNANVTLWKENDYQQIQIHPNASLGITYDPRKGFHFDYPRWDSSVLECHYHINTSDGQKYEAKSTISLHWSILPIELHPIIDDTQARHIFINDTFTLRCFVHIDIGVIIVVDWDHPNNNHQQRHSERIFKSAAETTRQLVNNNSYDTVAINITIVNATKEDEGLYRCNATDGNGRTFSATKRIVIFDEHLVSSINFTTDFHTPIIGEYGHDIQFTINAQAFPDISFIDLSWYKDGNELSSINTNNSHIQMNLMNLFNDNQTQITLYMISARPSDSGLYTLVGQTSWSSQQQRRNESMTNISIPVYIQGDIEILIENHQDFYRLNHSYELLCKSYGYPSPSIQWQWHPCETVYSCLNDDGDDDDQITKITWFNITTSSSTTINDNDARIIEIDDGNETTKVSYLNMARLSLKARQSGVYRCFSSLRHMNDTIMKHQEIPFIVMDAEDLFEIRPSTDEPTVNDTIILTCKASVYRYSQLWWVNTRLDTDIINPINVNTMLEQKNQSTSDPLIESMNLSNDQNEYSLSSTLTLSSVTLNHSSLFTCEAVLLFDALKTERKEFFLNVKEITPPIIIETNMNESIIEAEYNSQTELRCYIEGRPRPQLEWYRNDQPLLMDHHDSGVRLYDKGQRIVFTRLLAKDSGLYVCRGRNRGGEVTCAVLLKVIGNMDQTSIDLLPIVVYSIMGAITIIMACLIGKRIRDEKLQRRELEFFSKTLFEQGQMQLFNPDMPLDEQIDLLPYDSRFEFPKERLILGRTLGQGAFGRVVKAQAIGLDESDESESTTVAVKMLKERADSNQRKALMAELKILIHLGRHLNIVNLLGAVTKNLVKGELLVIVEYCQFGNLRHYLIANRDNFINQLNPLTGKVDRSIIRINNNGIQQSVLYQNVDILTPHTPDSPSNKERFDYFIANNGNGSAAMAGISYVDLLNRQMANTSSSNGGVDYINTAITNPIITTTNINGIVNVSSTGVAYYNNNYGSPGICNKNFSVVGNGQSKRPSSSSSSNRFQRQWSSISQRRQGRTVTTSDLICWAFQCSRGMDYLTMRKLIHRDLAARNVLLASNNVVKICDFGLAKDVYKYDNYIKKDDGPLPIKWMAIESISDKIFTSKSDVWSYGILLWELFTLGKTPYPGVEIDEEFYKRLKNGYRMEKPDYASEEIYELMLQCWNANPNDRPDFADIADLVGEMLDDKTKKHYIELNNPYLEMNEQILGTSDYLKMSSNNSNGNGVGCEQSIIVNNEDNPITTITTTMIDECEYETNISQLIMDNNLFFFSYSSILFTFVYSNNILVLS
ncbi:vascular endothelial growth factor receptor 3 [Dermatophagoides farinae]|uniref:receptor protein-tyrosine kinase n=1 Tax=Dermatophagoides farinae TaxID=6954 RepID=A0A9D4SIZ3_DERFA|nr:vascular endothelial growth factor receptor 3 [Dermatophagoides farinae]